MSSSRLHTKIESVKHFSLTMRGAVIGLALFATLAQSSDFGTTGLIDTPTARMKPDGSLTFTLGYDQRHKQFGLTYQALPWLEMTYRYTGFEDYDYWDRNYEVKALLWEEVEYSPLPQVALGIRDAVGTGVFGAEYLVASKRFGQWDASLGVGWGRLAGKGIATNPLTYVADRFEVRSTQTDGFGEGGELASGDFFSGPNVGVFGGFSYAFSSLPLTAMVEYNPDQYTRDVGRGASAPSSAWSAGVTWQARDNVDLALSIQHGDEIALRWQSVFDSKAEPAKQRAAPIISSYYLPQSEFPEGFSKDNWFDRLQFDADRSGLTIKAAKLSADETTAEIVVGNLYFQLWSDALATHLAYADLHLPATVDTIYFVIEERGHTTATVIMPRPSASQGTPEENLYRTRIVSARALDRPLSARVELGKRIETVVNLRTRVQLFDPDAPLRYQVYAAIDSGYRLNDAWSLQSSIALNLDHNFDESNRRETDSLLPPVRTDIVKYLDDGATRLNKLALRGRFTHNSNLHTRVTAGVLEQMYSGFAGEVLYWPVSSRIAYGASLAYAKKRDYDGGLGHLDYDAVTGFVSAYYASRFYNYDFGVHVGQYLAEDQGVTLEARRTFRNGWQVGLWASFTDVSSEEFGEGSFDKGFYFQIPIGSLLGGESGRSNLTSRLRPIQRDGGQRLEGLSGDIFWDLRQGRFDSFKADARLMP